MRDSVGGTWLFGLIITFMLIFVGYLTLMINYSTVFKNKNEVVHMIERYEGMSDSTKILINNYLRNSGYSSRGRCPTEEGWMGIEELSSSAIAKEDSTNAYYCYKKTEAGGDSAYYDVRLFLHFDIPVLGQLGSFDIKGQTIKIKYAK